MITLLPISTAQQISVYVRSETTACDIVVTDEQTAEKFEYDVTGTYADGKFTFDITHPFTENRFYMLNLFETGTDLNLNKTKLFATAQTDTDGYSMTTNYFTIIEKDEQEFTIKGT